MGKNQAYKAMQRSRVGSSAGGPEEVEDGMTDGSFHSPEWHAARLASLKTSHTITWEEYKRKQKEDEVKKGELEADKDKMMKEYRAQLDAERASKLAHGRNHSTHKSHHKKERKEKESKNRDKDHKRRKNKRKKHSRRSSESSPDSSSSSSSESIYTSDEDDVREARRSKSRSKGKRKESKSRSKTRSKRPRNEDEDKSGPLPLSKFFGGIKS
ncbi:hypothetical protein ZOSMA_4G01200 [Zostera marina]|uniref:Uncharacterized protein n=1 Tax=Zostera marina TaxID=29655 RepID=A0A0K9NYF1_ZOSMR|nr:hypothetical protein ZOSMA_4G01200 [Zostera marina]